MKTFREHTGCFFKVAIVSTAIIILSQIIFQIVLVAANEDLMQPCGFLEIFLRHIGFIRLFGNVR